MLTGEAVSWADARRVLYITVNGFVSIAVMAALGMFTHVPLSAQRTEGDVRAARPRPGVHRIQGV